MDEKQDELKVLTDEDKKKLFVYNGKNYFIGKISIKQSLALATFLRGVFKDIAKKLVDFKVTETNQQDMLEFLGYLEPEQTAELFGIILKESDHSSLLNIGLVEATEIIAIFCEQNDIGKLLKNVQRVTDALKK